MMFFRYVKCCGVLLANQLTWQHFTDLVVNKICIALDVFHKLKCYVPPQVLVQV